MKCSGRTNFLMLIVVLIILMCFEVDHSNFSKKYFDSLVEERRPQPLTLEEERRPQPHTGQNGPTGPTVLDTNPVLQTEPMALCLVYWEQTANALKNLIDLQCWAKSVNISKVLEPSVKSGSTSIFQFLTDDDKHLKFRDLFDLDNWNDMSAERGFSPLVPQEYFLEHATKEVVLVQLAYCFPYEKIAKSNWYKFLTSKGFNISRTPCIRFKGFMSEAAFQDEIFGTGGPNVSVIFSLWMGIRGFDKPQRVALKNSKCSTCLRHYANINMSTSPLPGGIAYIPENSVYPVTPSQSIQQYIDQFMSNVTAGGDYIAVMLRTQKITKSILSQSPSENTCVKRIVSDWNDMKQRHNVSKTFVFADIGKHGSATWHNPNATAFAKNVQDVLRIEMTADDVDSILERITGSKNSVRIAVINRELVARARCMVMVGGGAFQMQTAAMYSHYHKGQECYSMRNSSCDSVYISQVFGRELLQN